MDLAALRKYDLWDFGQFSLKNRQSLNSKIRTHLRDYGLQDAIEVVTYMAWDEKLDGLISSPNIYSYSYHRCTEKDYFGIADWHYDGEQSLPARNFYLFVWANKWGTEIRSLNGDEYTLDDGVLYAINNAKWLHRMPRLTNTQLRQRKFFRFWMGKT